MQTRLLTVILSLLGEGLIAAIFFLIIPFWILSPDVRVLDFIVVSIIYLLITCNVVRPFGQNIGNKDRKDCEMAGLGIRWITSYWYSLLAGILVIGNIIFTWITLNPPMAFKWQLVLQAALFLFLMWGWIAANKGVEQANEVFQQEKLSLNEKRDLKYILNHLHQILHSTPGIAPKIKERVAQLAGEIRYLSPSLSPEAQIADGRIKEIAASMEMALSHPEVNNSVLDSLIGQMEHEISLRKKAY